MKRTIDLFNFITKAEQLKNTLRSSKTSNGRQESAAEHSWMLSLFALLISKEYPALNHEKILSLCIIHDIAEAVTGDIPAPENLNKEQKEKNELIAMNHIVNGLPSTSALHILSLWYEYNEGSTDEAKLVKALDKIETIFQHNLGINQNDFDYSFNLTYGDDLTSFDGLTRSMREYIDQLTVEKLTNNENNIILYR